MLIWKVIAASPGITRAQIWARVEHDIPAGYAKRRFAKSAKYRASESARNLETARSFVLSKILGDMRNLGTISTEGVGINRRFTAAREPRYHGNPDAIDETGTKAAEHMALADALRACERVLARGDPERKSGPAFAGGRKDYAALALVVKALRAS
jgi:hypothetical protein